MKKLLLLILTLLNISYGFAQTNEPNNINALPTEDKIVMDGILDEPVWQNAERISNFTQRELNEGEPVTETTEVAIVYTKNTLYIGIWCYDSKPGKIHSKYFSRDFDYNTEDNFEIIICTFNDKRNGYMFVVNPLGARFDAMVTNEGEIVNEDWNGVWDAVAKITENGWFAELVIPFSTLQYTKTETQIWGINFERNIRRKNEQVLWQGWSRDYELETLSQAGTLTGITNISNKLKWKWEIKPYLLGGAEELNNSKTSFLKNVGFDINKNLLSSLKLNLTVNTDFAQVEADRIQVNLSRFSLYYPEKREFFLEGAGNFQFYLGGGNSVFYSRRIGIQDFKTTPIIGGSRLFGKFKKTNVGVFSIQTAEVDTIPTTNYSLVRLRQDIGNQSYVGMIATSKINGAGSNQVYGIDGKYNSAKLFKNKNISIGGMLAMSQTQNAVNNNNLAYRFFVDYPNDLIDNYMGVRSLQKNFNPEMGFLRRADFTVYSWAFRFTPRWLQKFGMRKLYFKPWDFDIYYNTAGELESYYNEIRPLGFSTKSGEFFEFNLQQNFDHPKEDFNLSDSITVTAGKYKMNNYELQFGTFQGRRFYTELFYNNGDYYGGSKQTFATAIGWNVSKHLNLTTDYTINKLEMPQGNLTTHELSGRIEYAFTTRLTNTLFVQWNSEEDLILFNYRLHWIPKIGSDFYFVITQAFDKHLNFANSTQTIIVRKFKRQVQILG